MKKRLVLLTVLALILSSIGPLTALAQGGQSLLVWADETRAPVILALGEQFAAEYNVTIEVTEMGAPDARDQIQVAGPAGEGPDIIISAHDHLGVLVTNGMLSPLDLSGMEENFLPSALDAVTIGGERYCLPYATENPALIRNPDLVPEPPATWQDVTDIAAQMAAEDKYAFLVQSGDTYHHFPIITAFGGYIFGVDDQGNYDVNDIGLASEGGLAAASWLQMMTENGYMVPGVTDDVVFEMYTAGDLAMFVTGPWWLQRLRDTGQPYVIESFPGVAGVTEHGRPFSGVQCFAISAFSENQLLAETFLLDFVATDEGMQALFDADPRPSAWLPVRDAIDDPDIAGFAAAGAEAVPMPNIPEMGAVWAAAGNALNLIVNGQLDGPTAFRDAADQIRTTIEQAAALAAAGQVAVGVPGSYQMTVGCAADWAPDCDITQLTLNAETGMYEGTFNIPAGSYEFKVAINLTWDENYGPGGERNSATNYALTLDADSSVTFTYDPQTHILTWTVGS
jgi:maltose-binding protein MalE